MTTIIDPLGTPSVVYNRSGATIVALTGNGVTQETATPIPRSSELTIVLGTATGGGPDQAFALPTDGEIGDLVEFHSVTGAAAFVFAGAGQNINGIVSTYVQVSQPLGASFRQISSTEWAAL